MTAPAIDHPQPSLQRPPWFERRFAFVHPPWMLADFTERLRGVIPRLTVLLDGVGDELAHRPWEGKWSIAQNVGHLADVEELWLERLEDLRRGRAIYTPAPVDALKAAAARHQERPLSAIIADLAERRARLVDGMASATPELQRATALHERLKSPMRLVDCAQFYAEHDDHHLLRVRALRAALGCPGHA